jgi:16S rRNA U516 pseudouridylate synthase RsuA-like enzyme
MSEFKTTIEKAIEKEVIRRVDEELQNADIEVFYKGIQLDTRDSFNDGTIRIEIISPETICDDFNLTNNKSVNIIDKIIEDFSGVKK